MLSACPCHVCASCRRRRSHGCRDPSKADKGFMLIPCAFDQRAKQCKGLRAQLGQRLGRIRADLMHAGVVAAVTDGDQVVPSRRISAAALALTSAMVAKTKSFSSRSRKILALLLLFSAKMAQRLPARRSASNRGAMRITGSHISNAMDGRLHAGIQCAAANRHHRQREHAHRQLQLSVH